MSKGTINKVVLIGRLGADPQLKYTANNTAVANFNLATNESWRNQDGELVDHTDWHRIVAWRKLGEFSGQYLKKGSLVFVEGKIKTRSYDDQSGQKRFITEIVADSIQFVGPRQDNTAEVPQTNYEKNQNSFQQPRKQQSSVEYEMPPSPMMNENDDDLPF